MVLSYFPNFASASATTFDLALARQVDRHSAWSSIVGGGLGVPVINEHFAFRNPRQKPRRMDVAMTLGMMHILVVNQPSSCDIDGNGMNRGQARSFRCNTNV